MGISHTEVVNSKVVDFIHGDPIKLNSKSLKVDVSSISRSAENRCNGAAGCIFVEWTAEKRSA